MPEASGWWARWVERVVVRWVERGGGRGEGRLGVGVEVGDAQAMAVAGAGETGGVDGVTALHRALRSGGGAAVAAAVAAAAAEGALGAVDVAGLGALHHAAMVGDEAAVAEILAAGTDPGRAALDGCTPLVAAAARGHAGIVRRLLAAGADPQAAVDRVHTAARRAADRGDAAVLVALSEGGARIDDVEVALYVLRALERGGATVALAAAGGEQASLWDDASPEIEPDVYAVMGPLVLPEEAPAFVRGRVRGRRGELWVGDVRFVSGEERRAKVEGHWLRLERCAARAERLGELLHGRAPAAGEEGEKGEKGEIGELLRWCAAAGHADALEALIRRASAQERVDGLGVAARSGRREATARLLAAGADPNAPTSTGLTPVQAAADAYDEGVCLELVLAAGGDPGRVVRGPRPIHLAASRRSTGALRRLLAAGAEPDARDGEGRTALHLAAGLGELEAVEVLLGAGASVGARDGAGRTALHAVATAYGAAPAVAGRLLAAGAELDAQDERGWTPAMVAIAAPSPAVLEVLLDAGARGDVRDRRGRTPIFACTRFSGMRPQIARLVAQGGELDARDAHGETALFHAIRSDNEFAAVDLVELGADVSIQSDAGESALDLARARGHVHVIGALRRLGLMS